MKPALLFQQHRKVLDKGKPDDIMPAIKGTKVSEKEEMSVLIFVFLPLSTATEVHLFSQIFVANLILTPDSATNYLVVQTGTITNSAFIRNV